MTDQHSGMTRIVRERYENPRLHADVHFRINPADRDALFASVPEKPAPQPWMAGGIGDMLAIPVRLDEDTPRGRWQLVENGRYDDETDDIRIREEGALDA